MNASKMKNMIVIKDLPSNIVEEAYVILKPNVRFKKSNNLDTSESPEYIIKEAENVLNNYLSNIETNKKTKNLELQKIKKRYNLLKKICIGLGIACFLNIIISI